MAADDVLTAGESQRLAVTERGWASDSWTALGTTVELVATAAAHLSYAARAVRRVLDEVDRAANRFRPDSELSRLNAAHGGTRQVSPLFARAVRVALDAAAWTDGLVDPTIGAALGVAGYDRTFARVEREGPPVTLAPQRCQHWRDVVLDESDCTVRLPRGVLLDLGATAKALACDLAVEAAAESVACGLLLSIGGDISVAGTVPEGGWRVQLADAADPSRPDTNDGPVVSLLGGGLATSGTQARRWRRGGSWLHHIIDPRTGTPSVSPWTTATVFAPTCLLANAASTAAIILGADAPGWLARHGLSYHLVPSQTGGAA